MKTLTVHLGKNSYPILIGEGSLVQLVENLEKLNPGTHAHIVTNSSVFRIYRKTIQNLFGKHKNFSSQMTILPDKEETKSLDYASSLVLKTVKTSPCVKKVFFVAIGGGVVGDLTGFTASLYKRGTPYIQIPTTLLSQVDASIGGKNAVHLGGIKNILGTFWQPKLVLIDTKFLKTLSQSQINEGLVEVIKAGLIRNEALFSRIEAEYPQCCQNPIALEEIIYEAALIKKQIVEEDEHETKNIRTLLNFGHTFGHAIEAVSQFKISHGKAVAIGILGAAHLSTQMGILQNPEELKRIEEIIFRLGITEKTENISPENVYKRIYFDKKFINSIRMVLLKKIGQAVVYEPIREKSLKQALYKTLKIISSKTQKTSYSY